MEFLKVISGYKKGVKVYMLGKIVKVVAVLSLFLVSLSNLTTQVFAAEKGQEHITNIELLDGNNNPKSDFGQYESMQVKYDFSFKKENW